MSHFSLNLEPPNTTLWYTPNNSMDQKPPYPFFYHPTHHPQFPNNTQPNYDDVDSDNSSSNAAIPDRSETASSSTTTTTTPPVPTHDKEHMFEKPLTPSDVGKLNRLVIPKQHAEKYLPLAAATAAAGGDTSGVGVGGGGGGGGGLLLGFEDETGKCWRFRYSYWNSSQSYVLTKGWSRYVKEKKLDAGDVVLFERHRFEPERFFIGWRRRGSNPPVQSSTGWTARSFNNHNHNQGGYNSNNNNIQYNSNQHQHQQNVVQSQQCYAAPHQISLFPNFPPDSLHGGSMQARQMSKKSEAGKSKRVRLFGVNLDCEPEEEENQVNEDEPQTSDGSSLSSQGQVGQGFGSGSGMVPTSYNYFDYVGYPPNHHNHMDMNFTNDFNQQQMRNRLG